MIIGEITRNLLEAAEAFTVPLRMGDGFDNNRFQTLCEALRKSAAEWADAETIPKPVANVLVDLASAIEASSYLYQSEESDEIRRAADTIGDLAREVVRTE